MPLFGGIEIPGRPDLDNCRKLDLLPVPMIRNAYRVGMAVEREHFHELTSRFSTEMDSLRRDIASYIPPDRLDVFADLASDYNDVLDDFNANSPEQVGKLLFDVLGIGAEKKLKATKTGTRTSANKKNLELVKLDHEVVPLILRHGELKTLVKNYTVKLPRMARFHPRGACCPICELRHDTDQWRIHGEMGLTRAATGRINHKNPNLGNVPARTKDGQAVQAGFVAPPGKRLVIRDLSQIELRGLAHLSNCQSMIDVYEKDGDLHTDTCWRTGLCPKGEKPTIAQRMGAKRCIAKGQRVLTNRGLVAIENVTCNDLVWDGVEWVTHDGVVNNGWRRVITYDGLTATPDHEVWLESGEKVSLHTAKRRGARLAVTGDKETPVVWYGAYHFREDHTKRERLFNCQCEMYPLRPSRTTISQQHREGWYLTLPLYQWNQTPTGTTSQDSSTTIRDDKATLRKPKQRELPKLRRTWNTKFIQGFNRVCYLHVGTLTSRELQRVGYRQEGQRRSLQTWKLRIAEAGRQLAKQTDYEACKVQETDPNSSRTLRDSLSRISHLQTKQEPYDSTSFQQCPMEGNSEEETETVEVYDIVNAGPRHCYTVSQHAVANCNFGIQNGTTEKGLYMQLVMDLGASGTPIPSWLTEDWCKEFIVQWLDSRPEVREFFEVCWYRAKRYGLAWEPFGRVRLIPEVKSYHRWIREQGLRQAQNMPVTSLAAAQLKIVMGKTDWILREMREREGVEAWPLLSIHDSIMVEADEEAADAVLEAVGWAMDTVMTDEDTGEYRFRVPIKSDGMVTERWEK